MAALIDTSTVVVHDQPAGKTATTSPASASQPPFAELLRWQAAETDSSNGLESDLTGLWQELLAGRLTIADCFNSPERWFMLLREAAAPQPVPERFHALFVEATLSDSQKRAASERGVAASTVSACVHHTLSLMGVRATRAKVPPVVALLVHASTGASNPHGRLSTLTHLGATYRVMSVERPELRVSSRLTVSEYQVIGRIVEGWSYREIARERRRSARTVANQVAGAFRRLGVSGRAQLLALLVGGCNETNTDARV